MENEEQMGKLKVLQCIRFQYGKNEVYQQKAIEFAKEMVKRDITLVYGGASVGIMGTVADTVLSLGEKRLG